MTTPPASLPAPPAVVSGDFQGALVPADVQARIISLLIDNAPFASSITRLATSSGEVVFPVASPEGAAWLAELQRLPLMSLNDSAYTVAVAKLAGLLDVSNEMIADSSFNITAQLTQLLRDSLSRQLDDGLLNGAGPPEPQGVIAAAAEVTGPDQLAAVLAARGQIADAGGTPDTLAASGTWLAQADNQRDASGALIWPRGISDITGLKPVTVPGLAVPALVYDSTRLYCVVRDDATVEASSDFRWDFDAVSLRVRARVACACPDPAKAIRKITAGGGNGDGAEAASTSATRARAPRASKS